MTARAATRPRFLSDRGASVPTTIMIDPWSDSRSGSKSPGPVRDWKGYRPSARPTGAPAICRIPPKLDCTSTPTT